MATPASTDKLRAAERRLQAAQLAANTPALNHLLDNRALFTSGPTGTCYTKHDDLRLRRTRQQILTKVSEENLTVLIDGRTGVTWFLGTVEGTLAGKPFAARLRYTRTWIHNDQHGWRIIAAHASHA